MRRTRAVGICVVMLLVATAFAGVPTASGSGAGGIVRGRPVTIRYRGERPPLRTLAARRAPAGGSVEADLAERGLLGRRKHNVNAPRRPRNLFPIVGWEIPEAANLPVSRRKVGLSRSWEGLNHFDSRFSNGGNQFSGEPPDQGLCVGNNYVMETVNSVVQIYNTRGRALIDGTSAIPGTEPVGLSLSEFYGYPPAFDRTNVTFGPFLFDVSCYFDIAERRWFHLADDLAQDPATGDFTGGNTLDLAVSKTANPLGGWRFYTINTVNDGTGGTPDHNCAGGPCFADYPHIGADANSFYITTNEYPFFNAGYSGAQLYAISKHDLVAGVGHPTTLHYQNLTVPSLGQKAFTLRGAQSRPASFDARHDGTAWLVSSTAGDGSETGNTTGGSDRIVVWALTGTRGLDAGPYPVLRQRVVRTLPYVFPPLGLQRSGPTPLLDCINAGTACLGEDPPFQQEGPYPLDSGDTRVMSAYLEDGVLWSTLDTGLAGAGGSEYRAANDFAPEPIDQKAGILYFAIRPFWDNGLKASMAQQGYIGVRRGNLSFPSIAMGGHNLGFIGATLNGPRHDPSAVYIKVGLGQRPRIVRVAAPGRGPDDGFTGTTQGGLRPRWGDYGYAVPGAGGTVWLAAEYIAQRCGLATFVGDDTCGGTRSFFANWSTRIVQLDP